MTFSLCLCRNNIFFNIIPASLIIASYVKIGALKRIAIATASEVLESSSISLPFSSIQYIIDENIPPELIELMITFLTLILKPIG